MNAPTFLRPNQPRHRIESKSDGEIRFWRSHAANTVDVAIIFKNAALKLIQTWNRITVSQPDDGRIYLHECTDHSEGWCVGNTYAHSVTIRFRLPKEDSHIFAPYRNKPLTLKYDDDLGLYYLEVMVE